MESNSDLTLPYERAKKLPDGSTVLAIRVKDLPLIVESLERLMFAEDQEEFSVQWVLRESLKDSRWESSVEAMEKHPTWDSGIGGWDVGRGSDSKASKHQQ